MNKLFEALDTIQPFYSKDNIWDTHRLSNFVLETHLNEALQGGSKSEKFIKESIGFIKNIAPHDQYNRVLDLGCGPGLYSNKLAQAGYDVTGVDISKVSIDYAQSQANQNKNLKLQYYRNDLFDYPIEAPQDIVLLIYQLYGTFSLKDRERLLHKVHENLTENGLFIIDALTINAFHNFEEQQVWSFSKKDNLISNDKFLVFMSAQTFDENITLQKSTYLFKSGEVLDFSDWNQYFTFNMFEKELNRAGFDIVDVYGDVNGEQYNPNDNVFSVIAKKKGEKND